MRIWERFPDVATRVREEHEKVGLVGHHDFMHAYRVGEVAYQVALTEWSDDRRAQLAGLAGLCHNADHLLRKQVGAGSETALRESIAQLVQSWIERSVDKIAMAEVIDAVVKHNQKNSANDSLVLVALMDADRVVNLDVDLFIRSGQMHHKLPAVDHRHFLDDPKATYRDPKSVLRDIGYSLDWANPQSDVCIRTREGIAMARNRLGIFLTFFDALKMQLTEEGAYPFPL